MGPDPEHLKVTVSSGSGTLFYAKQITYHFIPKSTDCRELLFWFLKLTRPTIQPVGTVPNKQYENQECSAHVSV